MKVRTQCRFTLEVTRTARTTRLSDVFVNDPLFGHCESLYLGSIFKNLLMPLFLMGCFPLDFHEVKRPLRTKSGKRPIEARKRPIKEAKRPIKAMVLVGISVGCLMGCFRAPQPCRKTAPLKRPLKRSMIFRVNTTKTMVSMRSCDGARLTKLIVRICA